MPSLEKPPLGAVPFLPPRGWCSHDNADHAYDCPYPIPVGGPHLFAFPDAPIATIRAIHVAVWEGLA